MHLEQNSKYNLLEICQELGSTGEMQGREQIPLETPWVVYL